VWSGLLARVGAGQETALGFLVAGTLILCLLLVIFSAVALLARARATRKARRVSRLEAGWEPAALEALEGTRTAASVQVLVRERDALLFVDFVSRLARRLRGDERHILAELVTPWLPRLAQRLTHRDEAVRARAVQTISLLAFGAYDEGLVRALDDESPLVAMAAARALARPEHPEFAAPVLQRLPRFTRWRPEFVSAMLAGMGPAAIPALLAAFDDPAQPAEARAIVADALRVLHVLEAADIAAALLGPVRNRDLVAASLRLLQELGREEHVAVVRPLLTSVDDVIRAHAIAAFGALAAPAEMELLVPALEDRSRWVALAAARALRPFKDGAALRVLARRDHPHAMLAAEVLADQAS
jgi:HEAT repeat protein